MVTRSLLILGSLVFLSACKTANTSESISQLESKLAKIDTELQGLSELSLNSGIGPIGYRSEVHQDEKHPELVGVNWGHDFAIDEIILIPALWRDTDGSFISDGFPSAFQIIAGKAGDSTGTVIAEFDSLPHLSP